MPFDLHQATDNAIGQKFALQRSSDWGSVERDFKTAHPKCAACGVMDKLNVHHMFPFHYVVLCGRPDLELDPRNLVTLCTEPVNEHHLLLGHLDDFESYNPDVLTFIKADTRKTNLQIRSDATFQKAHLNKPKHLDQMTQQEKDAFKHMLDHRLPVDPVIAAKAAKAAKARAAGK